MHPGWHAWEASNLNFTPSNPPTCSAQGPALGEGRPEPPRARSVLNMFFPQTASTTRLRLSRQHLETAEHQQNGPDRNVFILSIWFQEMRVNIKTEIYSSYNVPRTSSQIRCTQDSAARVYGTRAPAHDATPTAPLLPAAAMVSQRLVASQAGNSRGLRGTQVLNGTKLHQNQGYCKVH